jgi:2-polyprenyl-3-methyl-5-hydroxy-6-metoxy-1,4-benzoquinol methylase
MPVEKKQEIKEVEESVLKTFKTEIPSVHFSDKTEKEYRGWIEKLENLYHSLLHFPPKMFEGCSLIDFGAGTGENTIQFANWGAKCTLVDASDKSSEISKKVFEQYAPNIADHKFKCVSIFDYEDEEKYDIAYSNGVIHHTGDKEGAFDKIASFVKPGGYVVLGIGNKAGGFQNMLQRMIIYRFANSDDDIVDVAEKLFKEDIDRSQKFSIRTRKSMIYDRFVVSKQDDPSVSEVLEWFTKNDLTYYSSYPPILVPALSDSDLNPPTFAVQDFVNVGAFTEAFWLAHKNDDDQELPKTLSTLTTLSQTQFALSDYVNDANSTTSIDFDLLANLMSEYRQSLVDVDLTKHIKSVHEVLFGEVERVLEYLQKGDLEGMSLFLKDAQHLFRGANGLRHMYFIARKSR